jgi:hypothetical protein
MPEVKLNLIPPDADPWYPTKPGDASIVDYGTHLGLVWCCPQCGEATSTANGSKHVFDPKTNSLTPSIVHSKKLGGCGYHGFLTNGIFKEC